jgi:hypothetical protein
MIKAYWMLALCGAVALFAGAASAIEALSEDAYKSLFSQFRQKFSRNYDATKDEDQRFKNFKSNVDFIREHNANTQNTFKCGMNEFGDLTQDEWNAGYKGLIVPDNLALTHPPPANFNNITVRRLSTLFLLVFQVVSSRSRAHSSRMHSSLGDFSLFWTLLARHIR